MKRLFKWGLLLSIVVAACLTIVLFNPALIRSPAEHFISKISGFDVRLAGDLHWTAGKTLTVTAKDVHVSNPGLADEPEFAVLGSLQISVQTASLFSDAIIVSLIDLDDAVVRLVTNKSGISNWVIPERGPAQKDAGDSHKSINIQNIQINNADLNYLQAELGRKQVLKVSSFVQSEAQNGLLNIKLAATFNDRPAAFEGHIGTFANIIKGRDVSFDGNGQLGPVKVSGSGVIDDLIHPKQPKFDIKLFGPDIKDVTAMLKTDDLGSGPFDLQASGRESKGKYAALIEGTIGDVTLKASASSQTAGDFKNLSTNLHANGPNLGALARSFGQQNWPDLPFNLSGEVHRSDTKLTISAMKLDIGGANFELSGQLDDFPHLNPRNINLSVKGDDIARFRQLLGIKKGVASGEFALQGDITLSEKGIRELNATLQTALGTLGVDGTLGAAPTYSDTRLKVNLNGHNAHQLMSIFGKDFLPEAPFSLVTDLHFSDTDTSGIKHIALNKLKIEMADTQLSGDVAFDAQNPLSTGNGTLLLSSPDIANLKHFQDLEKAVALIVPGQPFKVSGKLLLSDQNWELKDINGTIGAATLAVDGSLSPSNQWSDSSLHFRVNGPSLHLLLNDIGPSNYIQHAFTSKGLLQWTGDTLELSDFKVDSENASANLNGSMTWPFSPDGEIKFDITSHGDDISRFVPQILEFKTAQSAFGFQASGTQRKNLTSIKALTANVGSLQLTLSGDLDSANREQASANIRLNSADISDLGLFRGRALPDLDMAVTADIHGNHDHFKLEQLKAKLGDSELDGTLEVFLTDTKPKFIIDSTLEQLDIRPFHLQDPPDSIAKPAINQQQRQIPAIDLPIKALSAFDATIDARIKRFKLHNDDLKNVVLKATINEGMLDVPVLSLEGRRGSASASLQLKPGGSGQAEVSVDLQAVGLVINTSGHPQFDADKAPTMDLALKAHGNGGNLQQLASTATGSLRLGSNGGVLAGVNLGFLDNFLLSQVFNLILPKSKQKENTKLTCAAAIFELDNGIATTNPAIAFVTNKITLVSNGTLDLSTEKLNFAFKATPNKVLNVSAGEFLNSFIVVGGTLSKPTVGLDPTKVLLQGGAAIGTVGISLLARGLLNRVGNMEPVCQSMLEDVK